jgi:heat shock protein HtpX
MLNRFKTALLLGLLTGVAVGMGWLIGGYSGMLIAFGIAAVMNFAAYWWSDKLVLKLYRAREVTPDEAPELYSMVSDLAQRAAIPMPRVYVIPTHTPNAFATGRNPQHAAVAVTEGLLRMLGPAEVKAVLAHELGHVMNRDTLISTMAATIAGGVSMLANMLMWTLMLGGDDDDNPLGAIGALLAMIVAPIAATLIQLAISRSREYLADETGAKLVGSGVPLARALEKMHNGVHQLPPEHRIEPATAHLFIVNPLSGRGISSWFSTHPPMEDRIQRLMAMSPELENQRYIRAA